jgi:hypothetical protein
MELIELNKLTEPRTICSRLVSVQVRLSVDLRDALVERSQGSEEVLQV